MIRVAIIDDHEIFRQRLRALLEKDENIEIVAEAGSGEEFLEIAHATEIDAACMDISMPGINGIETTRRLLAFRPAARVIGLSAYADPLYVEAMLQAGAVGYFTKGDADATLLHAVLTATAEHPCFGDSVSSPVASTANAETRTDESPCETDHASLSAREREVLLLIGKGLASAQIGQSLCMDPAMVDVYCRNIARKVQVDNASQLTEYALRHGYTAA